MQTIAVSSALVLISLVLVVLHIRAWRTVDHGGLGEEERQFHARRYRRRLQASLMLGVIGFLLLGDLGLEVWFRDPAVKLLYWPGVALLLLWLLLLAASDWLASRVHYRGQWDRLQNDRARLQADIDRLRRERNQ